MTEVVRHRIRKVTSCYTASTLPDSKLERQTAAMFWRTVDGRIPVSRQGVQFGMRWHAALLKADDAAITAIASGAQQLISAFKNPIDVSLISLRPDALHAQWYELSLVYFLNRLPEGDRPSADVVDSFGHPELNSGVAARIRNSLAMDPHVALAVLASRLAGNALFVLCSDTYCSSGFLKFVGGRFVRGAIYGWEGSSELWRLASDAVSCDEIELDDSNEFNYYQPLANGLIEEVGDGADELFLSGDDVTGPCRRFQLMAKRQLVSPVIGVQEAN